MHQHKDDEYPGEYVRTPRQADVLPPAPTRAAPIRYLSAMRKSTRGCAAFVRSPAPKPTVTIRLRYGPLRPISRINTQNVLERNGKTYISLFDFDDINFGVSICSIDGNNGAQFEVKLSSDNSKYSISIANQNIIIFNEREHCFKCVNATCKSKFHVYRDNRKEVSKRMTTKINRDSVKKLFGSGLITYTITIHDKADVKEETKEKVEPKEDMKDVLIRKAKKIFLQMLECPICKEYMSPPIYQCLSGHTLCNACKAKSEECSVCRAKIEATRNYVLEDVSKKVEVPQFDEKKPKNEGGVKRGSSEEVDGVDTPQKVQKK
ncbi:hypothetical protein NQ317_002134 [Molorchus minor]|uniref:E3 ubiquitin-protein ligase Sina-like RING finger domain-containing protein n=1 Tax=Molorchus minor TaxID=1323400 RepID=A0ABQ9JUX7_9CUCU|nr:hypothetical protein NQ317_002134 [Molorchus minor]